MDGESWRGAPLSFVKGHGTENDFVLLPDHDGSRLGDASEEQAVALSAALCDRRSGIGADGTIRVVRTEACADPDAVAARGVAAWFMDYRNADGSRSQMCGNGIRVLGRYLVEHAGVDAARPILVATRGGIRTLSLDGESVSVDMGRPGLLGETSVSVGSGSTSRTWPALHVSTGNPHAVALVEDLADAGSLTTPPVHDPAQYPEGVNVEFVVRRGPRHIAMRVHERGSGETRSCGTGACAAMVAAALADGVDPSSPADTTYVLDVPGGRLEVTWTASGELVLTGPAVLVATGQVCTASLRG